MPLVCQVTVTLSGMGFLPTAAVVVEGPVLRVNDHAAGGGGELLGADARAVGAGDGAADLELERLRVVAEVMALGGPGLQHQRLLPGDALDGRPADVGRAARAGVVVDRRGTRTAPCRQSAPWRSGAWGAQRRSRPSRRPRGCR